MTIVQQLADLGFTDVTDLGSKNCVTLVKVRTAKGWAYERFKSEDEVATWAKDKVPG